MKTIKLILNWIAAAITITSGIILAGYIITRPAPITLKPGRVVQDGRVYKISIDSIETDRAFGKQWRKNK
jgi:hypothetical protein